MRILELVRQDVIGTQDELAARLAVEGIRVTQATVSRDIKELNLVKVPAGDGRYRYALPQDTPLGNPSERLRRYFEDSLVAIDQAENLVLLKTLPGTAGAVASAIDGLRWPEVAGTVAGDDTTLVVVRSRRQVGGVLGRLRDLAGLER